MSKQKTPDDVQTTIGYRKPEISWQGHPRAHGFYAERGGSTLSDYYPSIFDAVLSYPDAVISSEAMSQLSEGEKRMLARPHEQRISQAGAENLVCLSEKFHTHPKYHEFYEAYCDTVHGFTGIYDLVIRMAETMTHWEEKEGGKELYDTTEAIWDEVADAYVSKYFKTALSDNTDYLPDTNAVFNMVKPQKGNGSRYPNRPAAIIPPDALEP
jgi:hypothetical protein